MCQYFRVFFTPINILPDTVDDLIMTCCIVHNLLRDERINCPTEKEPMYQTETYANNMISFNPIGGNAMHEAFRVRDSFKNYFNSRAGSVSWQQEHVTRTS